jgi:hypothetical protein
MSAPPMMENFSSSWSWFPAIDFGFAGHHSNAARALRTVGSQPAFQSHRQRNAIAAIAEFDFYKHYENAIMSDRNVVLLYALHLARSGRFLEPCRRGR